MIALKDAQVAAVATSTGTQGGRRPTGVPVDVAKTKTTEAYDSEVVEIRKRRRLTVAFKAKVLQTVETLKLEGNGAVNAYLRKEGLYYSSVCKWAKLTKQGSLTAEKSGPKENSRESLQAENKQLRRKLLQAEKKLKKSELIIDLQKKLSVILGIDLPLISELDDDQ